MYLAFSLFLSFSASRPLDFIHRTIWFVYIEQFLGPRAHHLLKTFKATRIAEKKTCLCTSRRSCYSLFNRDYGERVRAIKSRQGNRQKSENIDAITIFHCCQFNTCALSSIVFCHYRQSLSFSFPFSDCILLSLAAEIN